MPVWKVLFVAAFACTCLALVLGTIVVPLALNGDEHRWLWSGGLLAASVFMITLFTIFLRSADRAFMGAGAYKGRL